MSRLKCRYDDRAFQFEAEYEGKMNSDGKTESKKTPFTDDSLQRFIKECDEARQKFYSINTTNRVKALESERDALKAELETLRVIDKYRTSPTPWLSAKLPRLEAEISKLKSRAAKYREALERLHNHAHNPCLSNICFAEEALKEAE